MMLPTLNRPLRFGVAILSAALVTLGARAANAQSQPGECSGGNCGTPNNNGGGCGCGCGGSILVNYTDVGQSYEQSDDSDHDGIDDALDNCPYVANPDQADSDGDGVGNVCDNCVGTANQDQKANACGDIWSASSAGSNNAGMVIGAACDSSCTAAAAESTPVTVGVAPSSGPAKNGAASNSGGSSSNSGEVACSVRSIGATTTGSLVACALGLAFVGVGRRRRSQRRNVGC